MKLPANAEAIVDARKRGMKPGEMILVSLVGRLNEANHTVYVRPGERYDWVWVVGLQLCVFADARSAWRKTVEAIASCRPAYLGLWDADRGEGAQVWRLPTLETIAWPQSQWNWQLHFMPWTKEQNQRFGWN